MKNEVLAQHGNRRHLQRMKNEVLAQHGNRRSFPLHGRGHAEKIRQRAVKIPLLGKHGNRARPGFCVLQGHVFGLQRFADHAARGRCPLVLRHHGKRPGPSAFKRPAKRRPAPLPRIQIVRPEALKLGYLRPLGLHKTLKSRHASTLMPAPSATPLRASSTHSSMLLSSSSM